MKRIIYLLLILLWSTTAILAHQQNVTFRHLTTDDGLSQSSVISMYVDEQGGLWFGTREGLNYYNGNRIKTYKLQKNDPNSLFCNSVLRVTGNKNGKIYVLCTEGVAELDMPTQKFTTLLLGNISSLYFKDRLYIGKKEEVYQFNEKTRNFDLYYHLAGNEIAISCLHIDPQGALWLGTEGSGVYKLNRQKKLTHLIKQGNITNIYQDSGNGLWIGSWEHGLFHVAPDGVIENMRHDPQDPYSISSNFVRAACEDNKGDIWIGTFKGLNRYHKATGQFDGYVADSKIESLTHSSIWCIVKDIQGTLWLGTYFGGVNYFNPEYEIYTRYVASETEENGLSSPIVGRMIEDKNGDLWICTEGGGINVYNRKTGVFRWYRSNVGDNSLLHSNVKAIYSDEKRNVMWIGTHMGGLSRLDLGTKRFTHYRMKVGDPRTLPSDIVRDIIPYGDQLILATHNGVCLFDPETALCTPLFKDRKEGQDIRLVSDLFLDKNQTLWMAVVGEGIYTYGLDNHRLVNYRHDPNQPNSISNNNIYSIMQDSSGNIWFCTSGSGLDLYRQKTNDFENFDMEKNGLASDCVYEISESSLDKNSLWLITNQGFSHFNVSQRKFQNYSKDNGFPLTAVNENALCITRDGEVFLGGVQGMISFYEKNIYFTAKPYNIIFSRIMVNGKDIKPEDESQILQQSLCYTPEITLKADQNVFTIEYTTSNYIPANRDEIYYRLEGFSSEWSRSHQSTMITYTNLNPGTYTLVIKSEREGIEEAKLVIHVLPPWYKTWWAYCAYSVMVLGLLWYLIHAYQMRIRLSESLKYEKKHIEDMEALNQSKLRFFTNISHEFRTPLTLIVGQIETLLQVQNFAPTIYNRILAVYKNSLQLRELISELLDFRKQEQGHMKIKVHPHNLVDFLYENYLLFLEYASAKQINFNFKKEEDSIEVWYDQKQIQKVINNLLSNAFKHTRAEDTITIGVKRQDGSVLVEIKDSGTGIDAAEIDKIFDRFYQTERLDTFATGAGTGIGLSLTKGIIELHHGTLGVESKLDRGSSFYFLLKLGNSHFDPEQIAQPELLQQQMASPSSSETAAVLEGIISENVLLPLSPTDTKMLIVEDDLSIREMLSDIFTPFYRVTMAQDGVEGLERVKSEMPDIVVSDVVMPRMSGTELCREIKSSFDTCHIPVVMLTARTAVEHTVEGFRFGADDYITKPFNINILISRCNNLVNTRIMLQEKFTKQPQVAVQMLATNLIDKEMLDRAVGIIDTHLDDENFNINTFAREMGMARTNLFTKLKAVTGQTPNDFILTIRLKKGAWMLKNNLDLNISEISDKIGFSSSRYFSKCFKDVYNVSPMSYRKGEEGGESETAVAE